MNYVHCGVFLGHFDCAETNLLLTSDFIQKLNLLHNHRNYRLQTKDISKSEKFKQCVKTCG